MSENISVDLMGTSPLIPTQNSPQEVISSFQNQNTEPKQSHKKITTSLPLFLVLLILLSVGIAFAFLNQPKPIPLIPTQITPTPTLTPEPTPTPNSDWLTYKSDEYGFEFQYPQDWTISKSIYPTTEKILIQSPNLSSYSDSPVQPAEKVPYQIEIQTFSKSASDLDSYINQSKKIVIDGRNAYVTAYYPDGMLNTLNTFIDFTKDEYLKIGLWPYFPDQGVPSWNIEQIIYEQIVSTFRFADNSKH